MDLNKYLDLLKLNILFQDFAPQELSDLLTNNSHSIVQYKKNNIIHFESEKCRTMDLILQGEIIIQRIDEKGNVLTVAEFSEGDSIGGNLLFSHHPFYPMSVFTKTDVTILQLKKDLILQLCQHNRGFLLEFLTCVSDKAAVLSNKIKSISLKSIRESIIDFLNYEYHLQKSSKIKLSLTKKELAEKLGIQRTSLSRELSKMRKDGLISYDARTITIQDLNIIRR